MGIISTDILCKTALEASINDLRKNQWIIPDILSWVGQDKMSAKEYGWKEIQAFTEFLTTNELAVFLDFRLDTPTFPCITVASIPRQELANRDFLGDGNVVTDIPAPKAGVARPIYVYQPFTPEAYNIATGQVTMPSPLTTSFAVPGQFFVSSKTGRAYQIQAVIDGKNFTIKDGSTDDFTKAYIIPPVSLWHLHKERTYVSEHVIIGCHAAGNPVHCQWLHEIIWYSLLRTKEVFIEGRGFELSLLSSGPMYLNPNFKETDKIYSRDITLEGQLQVDFIKFQAPILEKVTGQILIADGSKTPASYQQEVADQAWEMEADNNLPPLLGEDHDEEN